MAEFAYNKVKNANTDYMPFEFNYSYHPYTFYKKDVDLCSQSKSADELINEFKKLIIIYRKNL